MDHHSGAALTRANGTRQPSFPRLAEASRGPLIAGSSSDDIRGADEATTACGGSPQEEKEAAKNRYRLLFQEICSKFPTRNWDKRRCTFASLVALQGARTEQADEIVRTVLYQSQIKTDPLSWFSFTVLERLKDHDLWSRDLCYWFNKRKHGMNSLESFASMFGD